MAIAGIIDDNDLSSIIKRSSIGISLKNNAEILDKNSTVRVSNTITSLQNAFNNIYTYTLNVKNIQKIEEKRLQTIKKEVTMETKAAPQALQAGDMSDIGNLPDLFKSLTKTVKDLTDKLDKLDLSSSDDGGDIDIDSGKKKKKAGRGKGRKARVKASRGLKMGGRLLGAIGIGLDIADRVSEDQSAGQIAAGVGGGIVGGIAGAEAGAALGALGGPAAPITVPLGALVGGALGYMGGGALGDKIYKESTADKQLSTAAANITSQQAKLTKAQPLSSTSFSSRFSDYITQSITNMSSWSLAGAAGLAGLMLRAGNFVGSMIPVGPGAGSTENAEKAMAFFMSKGWTREQAAGIVGNLQQESTANLDPNAHNEIGMYGIAQWDDSRKAQFQKVFNKSIFNSSFPEQLNFVQWELTNTEKAAGDRLRAATTAEEAAVAMSTYERYGGYQLGLASPDTRRRAANARALIEGGATSSVDKSRGGVGRISSVFGRRGSGMHEGIDIAAPTGTPVAAAYNGRIIKIGPGSGYGNVIYIDHGQGYSTRYGHLSAFASGIKEGTIIKAGDIIGAVGNTGRSTGPHLHYELRGPNGPADPMKSYSSRPWIVGGQFAGSMLMTVPSNDKVAQEMAKQLIAKAIAPLPQQFRPGISKLPAPKTTIPPTSSNWTGGPMFQAAQHRQ